MKRIKIILFLLISGAVLLTFCAAFNSQSGKQPRAVKIGVCLYKASDTFIASIASELEQQVKKKEQQEDITIKLDISDAKESQMEQNEQVERYIALSYDVVCVNLVDRTSAAILIDKAAAGGIPVIFFNREPVEEDVFSNDNVYYIGSDARKSAVIQAQIILEAYAVQPLSIDLDGNGIVEYAMLEGEAGHQDSVIRTEESIRTLERNGMILKKVCGFVANFDRSQSTALVEQWLDENPGMRVELFISNNDDMALGAVDALKKSGETGIPVVGIDGTPLGIQAVKNGELLGTAVSNAAVYAQNIFQLAYALGGGEQIPDTVKLENERYIWIPWESCTKKEP